MRAKPQGALLSPLTQPDLGDRVGQAEGDEVRYASLAPVWEVSRKVRDGLGRIVETVLQGCDLFHGRSPLCDLLHMITCAI